MPPSDDTHDRIDELSERLVDLEVKIAFQERTVKALDEVILALVTRLDHLSRQVAELEKAAPPK
jgi:uncharacterized coiled-coil protein SlyX